MLRRLAGLSGAERRALLAAIPLVLEIRVALRLRPLAKVLKRVRDRAPAPDSPAHPIPVGVLVWAVGAAGRRLARTSRCLTEALALWVLLRRNGHDGTIRIGVAREDVDGFEAHAWLESDGTILVGGERSPQEYVPLPAFDIG
jgi:hypothetical protein